MTKNARFWLWWHDGWVKITMRPDQTLEAGYGGRTDAGWSSYRERWSFDGDKVTCETESDGVDCDGRLTRWHKSECDLHHLAEISHIKQSDTFNEETFSWFVDDPDAPLTPDWQKVNESQYDQYAEMAGY